MIFVISIKLSHGILSTYLLLIHKIEYCLLFSDDWFLLIFLGPGF